MGELKLYRKRIIPQECILLEDDILLYRDNEVIITKWNTIRPKKTLSHGYSCYFLERGFKVSKFYDHDDQLISWYCDIIDTAYSCEDGTETYIFTDLLADVVVYPDGAASGQAADDHLQRGVRHASEICRRPGETGQRTERNKLKTVFYLRLSRRDSYDTGCDRQTGAVRAGYRTD